jgi:hypothetical protein
VWYHVIAFGTDRDFHLDQVAEMEAAEAAMVMPASQERICDEV